MPPPSLPSSLSADLGRLIVPALRLGDPAAPGRAQTLARPVSAGGIGAGGFLVFGGERESIGATLAAVREAAAGRALLMVADLERGAGQQVRGLTRLPHLMAIGAADDPALAREAGALTAREALSIGLNAIFAPCVDLQTDPANPIINVRALGSDPARVGELGRAWAEGCEQAGALACAKHYPGHGETSVDSHDALPSIDLDLATLEARELVPFARLAAAKVGMVMTGHLAVPALTGAARGAAVPVTVSAPAIRYLRETLGYDGLIVTDALSMAGIREAFGEVEAGVLSLAAGCDVLLCPDDPEALWRGLCEAARAGRVDPARVREAIRRLDRALARTAPLATAGRAAEADPEGPALAAAIARRAIARVGGAGPVPAFGGAGGAGARVVVVTGDADQLLPAFGAALLRGQPAARLLPVAIDSPASRRAAVLDEVARAAADEAPVAFAIASRPRMSKGTAGLSPELFAFVAEAARRAAASLCAAVAFGAPYLLDAVAAAPFLAAAFSDEASSQDAAAAMLLTGSEPPGRSPIPWPVAAAGREASTAG